MLGPLLFILCINVLVTARINRDLKSLVRTVNAESKLCEWFTANRLTLIIKKSNHVILRPHQRILSYKPQIWVFDNDK